MVDMIGIPVVTFDTFTNILPLCEKFAFWGGGGGT